MKYTQEEVFSALEKLASLKVIDSPNYWKTQYSKTAWLGELICKAAEVIIKAGERPKTVEEAARLLSDAKVINSPLYWRTQKGLVGELIKALAGAVNASVAVVVTEEQLRKKVCDIINAWVGSVRGDAKHLDILKTYNEHKPLARGYKVQIKDAHCATTVSAAFIRAGISEYTGTECGCGSFIELAKKKGIWVEKDTYTPELGDACVYDWQDKENYATTDNVGAPDHIGIVTGFSRILGTFTVTEGNMGAKGKVGKRTMRVNGRYIRGFICPKYAEIANKLTEEGKARKVIRYTVVSGDTLSGIAQKMLGSASRWKEIYDLNKLNSTVIFPGQTLILP